MVVTIGLVIIFLGVEIKYIKLYPYTIYIRSEERRVGKECRL